MDVSRFGAEDSDQTLQVHIPAGLLGFPAITQYRLVDPDPDCPLKWLQAQHKTPLAFVIIDPFLCLPDYHIELTQGDLMDVQADALSTLFLVAIVTLPRDDSSTPTVNLQGPVLINRANGWAKQLVLIHEPYQTQHPLAVISRAVS